MLPGVLLYDTPTSIAAAALTAATSDRVVSDVTSDPAAAAAAAVTFASAAVTADPADRCRRPHLSRHCARVVARRR